MSELHWRSLFVFSSIVQCVQTFICRLLEYKMSLRFVENKIREKMNQSNPENQMQSLSLSLCSIEHEKIEFNSTEIDSMSSFNHFNFRSNICLYQSIWCVEEWSFWLQGFALTIVSQISLIRLNAFEVFLFVFSTTLID